MRSTLAAFIVAFVCCAFLTPLVRGFARARGVVDAAGGRRVHQGSIPRLGGLAVAASFFVPLPLLLWLDSDLGRQLFEQPSRVVGLLSGGAITVLLGAADDLWGMSAAKKLAVQCLAGWVAFQCGLEIRAVALPLLGKIEMGVLAGPVTILWFVAIINAVNLIDGLDGLAAGIGIFACVTNLVVGYVNESVLVVLLSGALGGALLGFLVYNFNPASIFMGDSGSMFVGFTLAAVSLLGATFKSSTTVAIVVPILAMGVPITDTVFAFSRRLREGRPVFGADRKHLHHRLLDLGMTHRRAVLILYGFSSLLTAGAVGLALGRSIATGAALVLISFMLFGIIQTSRAFAAVALNAGLTIEQRSLVTALRSWVPEVLERIRYAPDAEDIHGAVAAGPPGSNAQIALLLSGTGGEASKLSGRTPGDAVFELGSPWLMSVRARNCQLSPQATILLQLVADAAEQRLKALGVVPESGSQPAQRGVSAACDPEEPGDARGLGMVASGQPKTRSRA